VLFLAIIQISVLLYDRIAEYIRILHGYVQEVRNKVCIVYLYLIRFFVRSDDLLSINNGGCGLGTEGASLVTSKCFRDNGTSDASCGVPARTDIVVGLLTHVISLICIVLIHGNGFGAINSWPSRRNMAVCTLPQLFVFADRNFGGGAVVVDMRNLNCAVEKIYDRAPSHPTSACSRTQEQEIVATLSVYMIGGTPTAALVVRIVDQDSFGKGDLKLDDRHDAK